VFEADAYSMEERDVYLAIPDNYEDEDMLGGKMSDIWPYGVVLKSS
jgi:hypothetical protein